MTRIFQKTTSTAKEWLDIYAEMNKKMNDIDGNAESWAKKCPVIEHLFEIIFAKMAAESDLEVFERAVKPCSQLLPPLEMSGHPSTICKKREDLNFEMSESFDFGAAAANDMASSVPHSAEQAITSAGSFEKFCDKFDPKVSLSGYLKMCEVQLQQCEKKKLKSSLVSTTSDIKRSYLATQNGEPKHGAELEINAFHHFFNAGTKDCTALASGDTVYDDELAASKVAGESITRKVQELKRGPNSRNRTAAPSSKSDPVTLKNSADITRAGRIYVAHLQKQHCKYFKTPNNSNHPYSNAEIEWARVILPQDLKVWIKQNYINKVRPPTADDLMAKLSNIRLCSTQDQNVGSVPKTAVTDNTGVVRGPQKTMLGWRPCSKQELGNKQQSILDISSQESFPIVTFSFSSKKMCTVMKKRMQESLASRNDHSLHNLKLGAAFSRNVSEINSTYEFKITSPPNVNIVPIIRDLFPSMAPQMRGSQLFFVPRLTTSSHVAPSQSTIIDLAETGWKANYSMKMSRNVVDRQREGCKKGVEGSEYASPNTVRSELQDDREVKRQRINPRTARMLSNQEIGSRR